MGAVEVAGVVLSAVDLAIGGVLSRAKRDVSGEYEVGADMGARPLGNRQTF